MHYVIYKTTCLVNGKYYIGKHKTRDVNDGYMGSGKLLKRSIKKYGIENFKTEILIEANNEGDINLAERIMVVPDRETNYNLCPGGKGGWGYINSNLSPGFKGKKQSEFHKQQVKLWIQKNSEKLHNSEAQRKKRLGNKSWTGKKHKPETIERLKGPRPAIAGKNNPMFGKPRSEETKQKIRTTLAKTRQRASNLRDS